HVPGLVQEDRAVHLSGQPQARDLSVARGRHLGEHSPGGLPPERRVLLGPARPWHREVIAGRSRGKQTARVVNRHGPSARGTQVEAQQCGGHLEARLIRLPRDSLRVRKVVKGDIRPSYDIERQTVWVIDRLRFGDGSGPPAALSGRSLVVGWAAVDG